MEPITSKVTIPFDNLFYLSEKIRKLQSRISRKALSGQLSIETGQPYYAVRLDADDTLQQFETAESAMAARDAVIRQKFGRSYMQLGDPRQDHYQIRRLVDVVLTSTPITLAGNGWEVAGRITHLRDKAGKYQNVFSGVKHMPERYRHEAPHCQYCGTTRRRRETWICTNGHCTVQVGSDCLRDFLGHDPTFLLKFYETFSTIKKEFEELTIGMRPIPTYEVVDVLRMAAIVLEKSAFVSSKNPNSTATSVRLGFNLMASKDKANHEKAEELRNKMKDPRWDEKVNKAMEWAEHLQIKPDGSNRNFVNNQKTFLALGEVPVANVAQVVYWVAAINPSTSKTQIKAEGSKAHYGTKGVRFRNERVRLLRSSESNGHYGITNILVFELGDAHLTWFASGRRDLVVGREYFLTGTVVEHGTYKDKPQTRISRCVVSPV